MDIKENLVANLIALRKHNNLTQAELAEKVNYSDKSISKWERGESLPDITVIKQLADIYGVTVDSLLSKPKVNKPTSYGNISKKRAILCLFATGLVWLIATIGFVVFGLVIPNGYQDHAWLLFVYAMPITSIILLILTAVWHKKLTNTIFVSILVWSILLCLFLTLKYTLITPPPTLWLLFVVGAPMQLLIIFWFMYRKVK